MKFSNYIFFFSLLVFLTPACHKDNFGDTSFVAGAASVGKLGAMFSITQDNTGRVTITPSGEGAVSFSILTGDTAKTPVAVSPGASLLHVYPEGVYQVQVTGHDLKGGTASATQTLTVSYIKPQDLAVTANISNLTVSASATAKYATFFKFFYGDSTSTVPEPYSQALAGQTVNHTYAKSGTYVVRVLALSGGSETAQFLDTIQVANQINLPVTFDDPNTNYGLSDFGGNASQIVADPTNAANKVMQSTKTPGAQVWAGTTLGGSLGFATAVPLTAASAKMTVMVYSPAAGMDIKLKVEDHNNGAHSVETDVLTTKANQWETLLFDFTKPAAGTPALTAGWVYDKASIFYDFGNPGTGAVFYCDNLQLVTVAPLSQIDLPVTFESTTVDYTMSDFGGNASVLTLDPTNASNHVMQSTKTTGAQTWAGTTMGVAPNGFITALPATATPAKMTVMVYSPAVGLDIKLKVEDHANGANSVETDVLSTKANQWETLTFDFSKPASGTPAWNSSFRYDKASLFFDFGNAGTGSIFYWDNVILL